MTEKSDSRYYPFFGTVRNGRVKKDKNGKDWIEFTLARQDKTDIPCRAFADKATKIIAEFDEGAAMRVVGKFEDFSFTRQNGTARTIHYVHIVWVGYPQDAYQAVGEE